MVDRWGNTSAHTGEESDGWHGQTAKKNFAVAGNMLVGERTLQRMVDSFENTVDEPLAERLILALEAGQSAGGDKRGGQSAAVKVVYIEDYPYLDLRVDEHSDPVRELRRIYEVAQRDLLPFIPALPTKKSLPGL